MIAYINSEFASIKAEKEGKRENVVENVVVNLPPKVSIFLAGYSRKKHAGQITCVFLLLQSHFKIFIAEGLNTFPQHIRLVSDLITFPINIKNLKIYRNKEIY